MHFYITYQNLSSSHLACQEFNRFCGIRKLIMVFIEAGAEPLFDPDESTPHFHTHFL
jgi:hypothetical protein